MKSNLLKSVALMFGLALLGSAGAQADYYNGGCEQNYRAEVICANMWVRDNNTGSVGFVTGVSGYNQVIVRFERGYYAGQTYSMDINAISPSYEPAPMPRPYPMPYPRPFPRPFPMPMPDPYHGGGWHDGGHDGHHDGGHDGHHDGHHF